MAADGCHNDRRMEVAIVIIVIAAIAAIAAQHRPHKEHLADRYIFRIVHQHVLRALLLFEQAKPDLAGIWIGMATGSVANNSMTPSPTRMAETFDDVDSPLIGLGVQ